MCAMVVERTGLALRVGLYKESTKVGNESVNLLGLSLPPSLNLWVQRVGCLKSLSLVETLGGDRHRRSEVDREIDLDAIRAHDVGILLNLVEIHRGQHLWRCVDIVEHCAVDADRGIGASVFLNQINVDRLIRILDEDGVTATGLTAFLALPEDRKSGISALDSAVEVIPVIQYAELIKWLAACGLATEISISAIKQTDLVLCRNHAISDTILVILK